SDSLHHSLGSVEAGPCHPRTRILQSKIFGEEAGHIDRFACIELLDELAKHIRLTRHQSLRSCAPSLRSAPSWCGPALLSRSLSPLRTQPRQGWPERAEHRESPSPRAYIP